MNLFGDGLEYLGVDIKLHSSSPQDKCKVNCWSKYMNFSLYSYVMAFI